MNLTLTVVKSPPGGEAAAKSFDSAVIAGQGATLGRQSDNDWVLPGDASLSRRHCRIVYEQGAFAVVDTSSLGSEVNGRRLANGQRAPLRDGDRINLSSYELSVSIQTAEPDFAAEPQFAGEPDFADLSRKPSPLDFSAQPGFPQEPVAPGQDFVASPPRRILEDFDFKELVASSSVLSPQAPETDEPKASDPVAPEREVFPLPRVRNLLPDDADIFADLRPTAEAPKPSPPLSDGLTEFLRGAGLRLVPERGDSNSKLRLAGETYRAALEGIRAILIAREQFKTEFRIEKTELAADLNNPVKPKLPLEDALAAMILGRRGFIPGPQAMREALEDVKAHEIALIAGIQVALTHLLEQLDPERLARRLETRSVLDGLPGMRKARLWEMYDTMHAEIARELEEDFQGSFGQAFAEAYGKYVRRK
jgi:type VI secretion system FHA domain protein